MWLQAFCGIENELECNCYLDYEDFQPLTGRVTGPRLQENLREDSEAPLVYTSIQVDCDRALRYKFGKLEKN